MEGFFAKIAVYSEATVAVFGAIGLVWLGMKRLYKMARNVEKLVEQSASNAERLIAIEREMKHNGGSSIKDAVHRIEDRLTHLESVMLPTTGSER